MSPPVGRGNHAVLGVTRRMSPVTSGAGDVERRSENARVPTTTSCTKLTSRAPTPDTTTPDTSLRPEVKCWKARGDCDGFRSERSIGEGKDNRAEGGTTAGRRPRATDGASNGTANGD